MFDELFQLALDLIVAILDLEITQYIIFITCVIGLIFLCRRLFSW